MFALGCGSFGYLAYNEVSRLRQRDRDSRALKKLELDIESRLMANEQAFTEAAIASGSALLKDAGGTDGKDSGTLSSLPSIQSKPSKRNQPDSWAKLKKLMAICMPTMNSRPFSLFAVQFFLLVCRALLSVKATRATVYYLSSAISKASWSAWTNWVVSFCCWMGTLSLSRAFEDRSIIILFFIFLSAGGIVVNSGLHFVETLIAISIRDALTRHIHQKYLSNNSFYRALLEKKVRMDNLDQRIAKDVSNFSTKVAFLYGHSFKPVLEFVLSLSEASRDIGWRRPLLLFLCSTLVSTTMRSLVPSLGAQVAREAEMEGDFVHAHSRLISHAEEIAFLGGGNNERMVLNESIGSLLATKSLHNVQKLTKSATDNFLKFFGLLLGGVFIHVPFLLRPDLSSSERISSFRATEQMMLQCGSSFTEILLLRNNMQELSGYTLRISELLDFLNSEQKGLEQPSGSAAGSSLIISDITISPPEDRSRLLIKDLSMEIPQGSSVLVMGPNGAGKTSLFRVIAGLWQPTSGSVSKPIFQDPTRVEMMLLPQKAYLCLGGTLRDQVTYPIRLSPSELSEDIDRRVIEALCAAGLARLCIGSARAYEHGINQKFQEWEECLSGAATFLISLQSLWLIFHFVFGTGGERQRVGFARLFFHRPSFACLDEATSGTLSLIFRPHVCFIVDLTVSDDSAVNPEGEEKLYEQLRQLNITVFSIAHRYESCHILIANNFYRLHGACMQAHVAKVSHSSADHRRRRHRCLATGRYLKYKPIFMTTHCSQYKPKNI
jgi:ABC-type uncharacterized transport system fused permease/ATPase subunit